jgi:hypothetical protein
LESEKFPSKSKKYTSSFATQSSLSILNHPTTITMQVMVLLLLLFNAVFTAALPHSLPQENSISHHYHHHHHYCHHYNLANSTSHTQNTTHVSHPRYLSQLKSTPPFPSPSSPPNPSLAAYKIFLGFFIFGCIMVFVFPVYVLASFFMRRKNEGAEGIVLEERAIVLPPGDVEGIRRPKGVILPIERVQDV